MTPLDRPIGVFDSGIGGLTVVRALLRTLPAERLLYLGDTARLPYGSKSRQTVRAYTEQILRFLLARDVKAVVAACNTASALALGHARRLAREHQVPVLGVIEPGARESVARSPAGRIGVLGTRATIESGAYPRAIRRHDDQAQIVSQPCPLFVPFAEEGIVTGDLARSVAELYLAPLRRRGVDTLLLGCTHYPVLTQVIAEVAGPDTVLVNSADAVARALQKLLARKRLLRPRGQGSLKVYLTDAHPQFLAVARRFLGRDIGRTHHVDL